MNTSYIIRLPVKPDEPVLFRDSVSGESGEFASVSGLQQLGAEIIGRPVTVIVPGELVTIHSLDITGRLTPAVMQSIPYRLEDDLATDVDDLHITVLEKNPAGIVVAIVENQWMECWQSWLDEAEIHASQWLPDTLALPVHADQSTALCIDKSSLLRTGKWDVAVCDNSWLELYLDALPDKQQKTFTCYGEQQEGLPDNWIYKTIDSPLQALEIDLTINLLQGRWQPKAPWKKHLKPFRLSGTLLALFVMTWLASTEFETRHLQRQAENYQSEARSLYQQMFPGERVVRLQSQLNQKISMLEQPVDNETGLLSLLDDLAPVFKQASGLTIHTLQFDQSRNNLRIEAVATEFETFSQFREQAGKLVEVNVESLEQKGEQVEGIMLVRSSTS